MNTITHIAPINIAVLSLAVVATLQVTACANHGPQSVQTLSEETLSQSVDRAPEQTMASIAASKTPPAVIASSDHVQPLDAVIDSTMDGEMDGTMEPMIDAELSDDVLASIPESESTMTPFEANTATQMPVAAHNDTEFDVSVERPVQRIISFPFDASELSDTEQQQLDQHIHYLHSDPEQSVTIHGHADAQGDSVYNRHLSRQRAQAVAEYLLRHGVDPEQLAVRSWGADSPRGDVQRYPQNRRVELEYHQEVIAIK